MRKILVIQTASIGDVILATPVLEKLHQYFPEAQIDFLVKKGIEDLFTDHPFLHEVLVWDKRTKKYSTFDKLMHRVWHTRYDLVVNLQRFFMTGLLSAFSRAGMRIGFDKNPMSFFFTHKITHKISTGIHETKRNLSLISAITDDSDTMPRLYPSLADTALIEKFVTRNCYTISPASLWYTKQYPAEKWVELLRRIPVEARVYLLGSPADLALCEDIIKRAGHPGAISLAGKLTFLQSAALMKRARMNFTNDSAPMHLASAVNAPVTAIYCSTVPEFGFGPLADNSCIVETSEKLPCRPCGLHGFIACPEKHFRCALGIDDDQLVKRL
ncbi:MAG: glycosyltransferase family 9 protein [Bacteroidota bacterium]